MINWFGKDDPWFTQKKQFFSGEMPWFNHQYHNFRIWRYHSDYVSFTVFCSQAAVLWCLYFPDRYPINCLKRRAMTQNLALILIEICCRNWSGSDLTTHYYTSCLHRNTIRRQYIGNDNGILSQIRLIQMCHMTYVTSGSWKFFVCCIKNEEAQGMGPKDYRL